MGLPTLMLFVDGSPVERIVGLCARANASRPNCCHIWRWKTPEITALRYGTGQITYPEFVCPVRKLISGLVVFLRRVFLYPVLHNPADEIQRQRLIFGEFDRLFLGDIRREFRRIGIGSRSGGVLTLAAHIADHLPDQAAQGLAVALAHPLENRIFQAP